MSKVLIFGGTSEGRLIAERLSESKIGCDVCVATEYGKNLLAPGDYVNVLEGRLSEEEMKALYKSSSYSVIIDATHPYAKEVSENIRKSLTAFNAGTVGVKIKLLRFERDTKSQFSGAGLRYFDDAARCAAELKSALLNDDKNVLLTTGSKELPLFCRDESVRKRIVARVIPSMESLEICQKCGLEGRQIIAMQGPFSQAANLAQISDFNAGLLITKESGAAGGFDSKIEAAEEAGIECWVIKKPEAEPAGGKVDCSLEGAPKDGSFEVFSDFDPLFARVRELLHLGQEKDKVILAGIGMGSCDGLTLEVQKAIKNASYLFGAERILSTAKKVNPAAKSFPYYLAKDIIPVIQKAEAGKEDKAKLSFVILFSGDTGFFSGAEKLLTELKKLENISLDVLPGISSMQYLFAKAGLSWQNTTVLNLHGVQKDDWIDKLSKIVYKNKQIFFITSSFSDVQELGSELERLVSYGKIEIKVILGYQLSYPEEKIRILSPKELQGVYRPGLYSGIIQVCQATTSG